MVNQFEAMLRLQIAMCAGWAKLCTDGFMVCETLASQQAKLLEHPKYLRLSDLIPDGASWFDHYGKRSHDVDVERV